MKKLFLLALVFLLSLGALVGCSGGNNSSNTNGNGNQATNPSNGTNNETNTGKKVLTIAQGSDLNSFDTQNALSTPSETILRNMFNRLFMRTTDMEVVPELLAGFELVNETTWKFTLKEGVTFHNGDPLTSEDVKFTFDRVTTDSSLKEYTYYKGIVGVNVIDSLTFELVTDGPMPTLFSLLAKSGSDILPKKYIEENGWDHFLSNPIGSGPYKFVKWNKDDRVVLEANDNYFGGKVGDWDEVVIRAIPESSTRVAELLTGGVDIATDIPPNQWDAVDNNAGTSLTKGDTTRVMLLMLRHTEGYPTADPRVREAIDLAIDDGVIAKTILNGSALPVRSRAPLGVVGSNPELYDTYLYDPERAKELLKEAGYSNGIELTLTAPKGRYLMDGEVAQLLVGMLAESGIKLNLELLEWSNFLTVYDGKTHKDMIMIALADGMFDASYSLVHYTKERAQGQTDYYNEEVENLFHSAAVNLDKDERIKQYQRIQEIVAEERPHIPLFLYKANYGVSDQVQFTPRLDEQLYFNDIKKK